MRGEARLKYSGECFYAGWVEAGFKCVEMGKVRTRKVKVLARGVMKALGDKVTTDFETNKLLVGQLLVGRVSKKLRNRVAGYLTSLAKKEQMKAEEAEAA